MINHDNRYTPGSPHSSWEIFIDIFTDIGFGMAMLSAGSVLGTAVSPRSIAIFTVTMLFTIWGWNRISWYSVFSGKHGFKLWIPKAIAVFSLLMFGSTAGVVTVPHNFSIFWVMLLLLTLLMLWSRLAPAKVQHKLLFRGHFISYLAGFITLFISLFAATEFGSYSVRLFAVLLVVIVPLMVWLVDGAPRFSGSEVLVGQHHRMVVVLVGLGVVLLSQNLGSTYSFDSIVKAFLCFTILALIWRLASGALCEYQGEQQQSFSLSYMLYALYPALISLITGLRYGLADSLSQSLIFRKEPFWGGMALFGLCGVLVALGIAVLLYSVRRPVAKGVTLIAGALATVLSGIVTESFSFDVALTGMVTVLILVNISMSLISRHSANEK